MTKDKNDNSTIDMFDEVEKILLVRRVRTPDGVILHSKQRHDCVSHTDANGVYYQLDGGTEGFGSCCNLDKCANLNLYYGDPHEEIREHLVWGQSFDKEMNRIPFRWVKLKDMNDGHLGAVMDLTREHSSGKIHSVMLNEWKYRKESNSAT